MENNTENNVASIIEENNTGNNIHSCDFVPFHAVLNTSDIINLGSIIYNICLLCVDTNVKYIVEKNNFIFV